MTSSTLLYLVAAAGLFGMGLYGLLVSSHALRKILALNVMGTGVFLLLVTIGQRGSTLDPVLQAMVLTGIVIALSATAIGVALVLASYQRSGRVDLEAPPDESPES